MPTYSKVEISRVAQQYGFVRDTLEKVWYTLTFGSVSDRINQQQAEIDISR